MRYPNYPAFVQPQVSSQIQDLEQNNPGIISAIRAFLEGSYDPTSDMYKAYLDTNQYRVNKATNDLRRNVIASQGAQRIYGAAAGQQLNQALIDKVKDDLNREQDFLWQTLSQIIDNRKFGIQAGQDTVNSARQYALEKASMENDYNMRYWTAGVQKKMYQDSSPLNLRNIIKPAITSTMEKAPDLLKFLLNK